MVDAKSPLSWVYGKWGARGVQLLVTAYLIYRYLRAFADPVFRTRLSGYQTQGSFYGIDIPYIAITLASPVIVLGLELWAQRSGAGKLDNWRRYVTALGGASLVAASIYVWMMCGVSDDVDGTNLLRNYGNSVPIAYTVLCLIVVAASIVLARSSATSARRVQPAAAASQPQEPS